MGRKYARLHEAFHEVYILYDINFNDGSFYEIFRITILCSPLSPMYHMYMFNIYEKKNRDLLFLITPFNSSERAA